MKKVILYGLGGITKEKEKMIKNINIVGYSDSFANLDSFDGKMFIKKDQLTTAEFDYILIMPERSVSLLIKQELKQYIPEEKLVVFDELYNAQYLQKVDRLELKNTYIEGIILGISHAVTGINDIPGFINASVRGQDAYYNVKTFEFIEKKCALDYLNTVIIEIYDYNYLNYDVSLTRRVVDTFYSKGGLFEYSHNFDKNIHFESSLHDIMKTQVGLDYNKDLFLFYEKNNGFEAKKYTNVISNDAALPARKFTNRLVQDRYESTIIENKKILDNFCAYLRNKYGEKLKIVFLFMPRFISMEIALKPHLEKWKEEIMDYLDSLVSKYSVKILDMKNESDISANSRFYNDVNHLNYTGARAFTDLMMKKIYAL